MSGPIRRSAPRSLLGHKACSPYPHRQQRRGRRRRRHLGRLARIGISGCVVSVADGEANGQMMGPGHIRTDPLTLPRRPYLDRLRMADNPFHREEVIRLRDQDRFARPEITCKRGTCAGTGMGLSVHIAGPYNMKFACPSHLNRDWLPLQYSRGRLGTERSKLGLSPAQGLESRFPSRSVLGGCWRPVLSRRQSQ
jgi:hypothetical protein